MAKSHTWLAKLIHWSFIPLYGYGILKQLDNLSELEDTALLVFEVVFATFFLLIVLLRYAYMRRFETFLGAQVPVHPAHRFFAKAVHSSMYFCLILLPLSGLAIAGLFTRGIKDGPAQDVALSVHEFSASFSYVLIVLHVGAALSSRLKGEGVWTSMVPLLAEDKPTSNSTIIRIAALEEKVYSQVGRFFSSKKE